jgi:hypothetical protein
LNTLANINFQEVIWDICFEQQNNRKFGTPGVLAEKPIFCPII